MSLRLSHIISLSAALFFISTTAVLSQIIFSKPLSQRVTEYNINAELDPAKKIIDGKEILKWRNTSNVPVSELQFHLYLNAFKNNLSTFMRESGGEHRGMKLEKNVEMHWGYIDILSLKKINGAVLTKKINFIQPDDGNSDDQTVASVILDQPVKPGEEIQLEIIFKSKLPKIFARTGYCGNYFLAGQWFPKIGVFEYPGTRYADKPGWNCHQFHANSEFYADFSLYDVNLTLPDNFTAGAVGVLQSKTKNGNRTITHHYRAEDVVDFAWTASPDYRVVNDQWKNVKIKLMIQPEHFDLAERHIQAAKYALEFFQKHMGAYPYTTLTIVDPPLNGMGSGGMEYPSFITTDSFWKLPEGIKFPELVTAHEFGHNYFMGILASNEFEEAFLDEGFNQYFETRIMDNYYGKNTSAINLFGFKIGDFELTRFGYTGMVNPKLAEIYRKSWEYQHGGYSNYSYQKPAVMLKTLEGLIGINAMDEVMKTYYDRWKFKHPCVKDFIAIVNEIVLKNFGRKFGDNMNWFFDQVLYGSDVCDYKLASITNQKIYPPTGIVDRDGERKFIKTGGEDSDNYKCEVVVHRIGEVKMPVEILVHFADGKEIIENWNGQSRTAGFTYEGKNKVLWAKIDPQNKIPLDINLVNNSLTTEPESGVFTKYAAKILFWLENTMLTFSMLF